MQENGEEACGLCLETHIMMSLLIFHLIFLLMLRLIFLIDLTIDHMTLVHERVALYLDALVSTHVHIMGFIPRVGMFSARDAYSHFEKIALTVHTFPIMVLIPLAQLMRCIGL
jgi:hypothetical protein